MTEIRWHGRGGQGAKTVSQLLAAAMLRAGYNVQAFPEYGPERSGAPLQAYTRYSTKPIRIHSGITDPDTVVVLDDSLLSEIDATNGLQAEGLLLVNSESSSAELAARLGYTGPIVCVDAARLASEAGAKHGNVVMVGALAALAGQPGLDELRAALEEVFEGKLSAKVIDANVRALEVGYRAALEERGPVAVGSAAGSPVSARTQEEQENNGN